MLASVITFLIYICILALVVYLVIWVLRDVVGLPIPEKVGKADPKPPKEPMPQAVDSPED